MNNICKEFNVCSTDIKNWLMKQPEVKEESLTDRFLYDLSERIPTLKYKQFTRREEGRKTGADWEWWFVFANNKSFAARVQAKKLKLSQDNYPGIAYTSGGQLQIERLLEDSAKDGFASFYTFYSTEDSPHTRCPLSGKGVFFGEANNLRKEFILAGRRKLVPSDILKFTNPIACLFCCSMAYKDEKVEDYFRRHIEHYFPKFNENRRENNNQGELGFRDTPQYILQLLGDNLDESWERESQSFFIGTNAVVVIDLRNNEK